jgi:hypothetical protein
MTRTHIAQEIVTPKSIKSFMRDFARITMGNPLFVAIRTT